MRNRGLDLTRGIAVLLVLGAHNFTHGQNHDLLTTISNAYINIGWVGVDLFFALSGYLIYGLYQHDLERHGQFRWKRFLIRRSFKIYPNYFLYLFFSLFFSHFYSWTAMNFERFLKEALFIQNYFIAYSLHTWSLAVEEHFYLSLVIFFFISLYLRISLLNVLTVVVLFIAFCRVYDFHSDGVANPFHTHARIDSMLIGCVFSGYSKKIKDSIFISSGPILFILALALAFHFSPDSGFMFYGGFSLLAICFSIFIIFMAKFDFGSFMFSPIILIGKSSYLIYLWHLVTRDTLLMHGEKISILGNSWVLFLLYISSSVALGVFLYKFLEIPLLKFRDKVYP